MQTRKTRIALAGVAVAVALAGCAGSMAPGPSDAETRAKALELMKAGFNEKGIAKLDRLNQDETQALCTQYATGTIPKDVANCYACHQLSKEEISYGTIGPSLYNFGKIRGYTPEMQKYAWGKVYNTQAYSACSFMPRFGHAGILTEAQIKDVVALLMDPNSPVNK